MRPNHRPGLRTVPAVILRKQKDSLEIFLRNQLRLVRRVQAAESRLTASGEDIAAAAAVGAGVVMCVAMAVIADRNRVLLGP